MCDFDICIDCKTVLEKRSQLRRARTQRDLQAGVGKVEVSDVVCLKTLCDKVAQIELARKRRLAQRKKVSVGVNTDNTEDGRLLVEEEEEEEEEERKETEGDTSQSNSLEKVTDVIPTDPQTNDEASDDDVDSAEDENVCTELYKVDVHLPNGHCSDAQKNQMAKTLLIDQLRKIHGEDGRTNHDRSNSYSCSVTFKDPPANTPLSRLKLTGTSLTSMSASPDIFHLRAPLVSWENFLTPSVSESSLTEL